MNNFTFKEINFNFDKNDVIMCYCCCEKYLYNDDTLYNFYSKKNIN